jgi:NAD-dependent deacetylase
LRQSEVIHLHGFLKELRCRNQTCEAIYEIGYDKQISFHKGTCPKCGEKLRPNIVFFGEMAPMYEKLNKEIQECEMLVVIGTSGNVIGVNTLAAFVDYSILNNLEPSDAIDDNLFSKVIYDKASVAVLKIAKEIEQFLA